MFFLTILLFYIESFYISSFYEVAVVELHCHSVVSISGKNSCPLGITCGVPQGSVLGPLLFLLYINDLPNVSKHLKFYFFADDTNLYYDSERSMMSLKRLTKG